MTTGETWDPRRELSEGSGPPNAIGVPAPYGFPPPEPRMDTRHSERGLSAKQQALTPGANFSAEGLSFAVRSIAIDNPSAQWWYVVNAGAWVPPYWVGRVFTIIPSQRVEILASTPGGQVSNTIAGEQAMATFYDAEIGPDDGEGMAIAGVLPVGSAGAREAQVTSLVVKATPGILYGFTVVNQGAAMFIQLHDAAALPANGAIPIWSSHLGAGQTLNVEWDHGKRTLIGIVLAGSTTDPALAIAGATLLIYPDFV